MSAKAPKIVVYWAPNSRAVRTVWALEELGVPYEKVVLDLQKGDQKKPEYLAINPNGKVPAITVDGVPMFESLAIALYFAERFGVEKGLWPRLDDPRRLTAMSWYVWDSATLSPELVAMMQAQSEWVPKEWHNPVRAEAAKKEIARLIGLLDAHLATSKFVAGDALTLADGAVFAIRFLQMVKFDLAAFGNVARWFEAVSARPAFVKATTMTP